MIKIPVVLVALLIFYGCGPVAPPPEPTPPGPSAEIIGLWQTDDVITGSVAGEIDGRSYLFLMTVPASEPPYEGTLRVVDIEDPIAATEVASLPVPVTTLAPVLDIGLAGTVLYMPLGGEAGGLWAVDVSDPAMPRELSLLATADLAAGLTLSGDYAYVTTLPLGLLVIDTSEPGNPQQVAALRTPGERAEAFGSRLLLADVDEVRIIDVSTPSAPRVEGVYADLPGVVAGATPGSAAPSETDRLFDVAVSGPYAYVASGDSGMRVLDVSTPTSPRQVAQFETAGTARRVLVVGDLVYLAESSAAEGGVHWSNLLVIDVSDPLHPELVLKIETAGYSGEPVPAGDHICFVDMKSVMVIDVSGLQ